MRTLSEIIKVLIVNDWRSQNSLSFFAPILSIKSDICDRVQISFCLRLPQIDEAKNYDQIWVNSKSMNYYWDRERQEEVFDTFDLYRDRGIKVKYIDVYDSAGNINRNIIPHVDFYFKSFLYKDLSVYTKKLYGGRYFTDYYHQEFNINDEVEIGDWYNQLELSDLPKLKIFWNHSLQYSKVLRPWYLKFYKMISTHAPKKDVSNQVSARFQKVYKRKTVEYHRQRTAQVLNEEGISTDKIPLNEYLKELESSRFTVSPYGWGEFAYRDYESFIKGVGVIKPNMDHIDTWPNLYTDNETYISYKLDFSDLKEKILKIQEEDHYEFVQKAHQTFVNLVLTKNAKDSFIKKFLEVVEI